MSNKIGYKNTQTAKTGDIIVAVTDMTQERRLVAHAARVHIIGNDFAVMSMDLVKVEPKEEISKDYLHGLLRFSDFSQEVRQHANGVNVLHLNPSQIQEFKFALPPKNGVKVSFRGKENEETVENVRVIDWNEPSNNDFFLASQFWVTGEMYKRRADLLAL